MQLNTDLHSAKKLGICIAAITTLMLSGCGGGGGGLINKKAN